MLAIFLAPVYILANVFTAYWLLRWMKAVSYTHLMAATLLIIGLINYFFLGSFYIRDKEHILAESFQKLNATCLLYTSRCV